ncbi:MULTISPECIES: protoporphyrinogen oxidase [unclassified Microcoleus]|uniref:protoporphyrinogen oxidase n=1 Tax=unclassified Microcoleus TaxID=2642155 RepID=UPI0025CBEE72|nr:MULTISPECIES: protoporphyrinogen oxidase [unclassified Microcoleus]
MEVLDTLIVGAGISGLSLAHALQKEARSASPRTILVAESQGRVGGNITTATGEGFLWEEGPNSFSPTPELLKLAVDVGLKQELIFADRKLPRFVYWQKKLQPVPMTPGAMIQSRLLSFPGKLRALFGALGFVAPAMGDLLSQQGDEETVSQFFRRHLGKEVMQRLVEPFVSGVYAGDPQQLSAAAAFGRVTKMADAGGGLVAGALLSARKRPPQPPLGKGGLKIVADPNVPQTKPGELGSFKGGLKALPEAIAANLGDRLKLNWHLTRLDRTPRDTYIAVFSTPDGQQEVEARTVVLTTPAYVTAELLQPLQPSVSSALQAFTYPAVASVVLAYPMSDLRGKLVGFGNLIPRGQGIRTLGTIWTSSLFANRAPAGWQTLTSYIGGATDSGIGNLDAEQIVGEVHRDLSQILLKPEAGQPKVLTVKIWKRAIPQYNLGHFDRLEQIDRGLKSLPGLYLCTNYFGGVALGDCVRRGFERAVQVGEYLNDR